MLCSALACEPCTDRSERGNTQQEQATEAEPIRVQPLATGALGLSGLTADDSGNLWAVGESGDVLVQIDRKTFAVREHRLIDCPPMLEPEAVTWVGGRRFVFGTESDEENRKSDQLFTGRLTNRGLVFESAALCNYEQWNLVAQGNRGMEGICFVDGKYLCVIESASEDSTKRWAPLGLLDPQSEQWVAHRLRLSTDTGKLSALSCRAAADGYEAIAVERHFGVHRLLRFTVPRGDDSVEIVPRFADLSPHLRGSPNLEGVVWEADGTVILISDNQYRRVSTRKNQLHIVSPTWLAGAWQELR